jgi:hypothetical protein
MSSKSASFFFASLEIVEEASSLAQMSLGFAPQDDKANAKAAEANRRGVFIVTPLRLPIINYIN